jgi:hypothetical protein
MGGEDAVPAENHRKTPTLTLPKEGVTLAAICGSYSDPARNGRYNRCDRPEL